MIELTGCLKTLGLSALAAGGLILSQGGFDCDFLNTGLNSGAGLESGVGVEAQNLTARAEADGTVKADAAMDGSATECASECIAPCASECVPTVPLSVRGAAKLEGRFDAAASPGDSCACSTIPALDAGADAGVQVGISSEEGEVWAGGDASLIVDSGIASASVDGIATIEAVER